MSANFDFLLPLRNQLGPKYGSEDLCVLLYSLVKREKPAVVVELGTGFGVTTAWIGAAMEENGCGRIYTFDNGDHFGQDKTKNTLAGFAGPLEILKGVVSYESLLETIFKAAGVANRVSFTRQQFNLRDLSWVDREIGSNKIEILFADYDHSPSNTAEIIASFLPRMAEDSSIFIDSASTHLPSYHLLEHLVQMLDSGKIPKQFFSFIEPEERIALSNIVANSRFKLIHLVEKQERHQNSTAWLKIERASLIPSIATLLH